MSKFAETTVVAATCLLGFAAVVGAQLNDGYARSGQMVGAAFRLMDAAYPEVRQFGKLEIRGNVYSGRRLREFSLQLGADELREVRTGKQMSDASCYARFEFSYADERLLTYTAHGRCAREAENRTLRSDFIRRRLSDDQLVAEIERRGGRFGPGRKEELLNAIPGIEVIEAIAGEQLILRDVTFGLPLREQGNVELVGYALHWAATFEVVPTRGVKIVAIFEPFDGRLSALLRIPPE